MSKYKLGIYRKKLKGRLGKYVYLRGSTQKNFNYELLFKKKFDNRFYEVLYETKGTVPYFIELFNYSWYEEKFYDKYEFIREGELSEIEVLEKQRQKDMEAKRKNR